MVFGFFSSTFITCLSSCQYWTPDFHPPSLTLSTRKQASGYFLPLTAMPHPCQFSKDSDPVLWVSSQSLTKTTNTASHYYLLNLPLLNWDIIHKYKICLTHFINSRILHTMFLFHKGYAYFNKRKSVNSSNKSLIVGF